MSSPSTPSRPLHYGLWAAQALLGFAFVAAGAMKATTPIDELAVQMGWVNAFPAAFVRFIGVSELLGGVGLVLPSALRIQPWLTSLAAALLTFTMVSAIAVHLWLGDPPSMSVPAAVLGALSAFVAWGRHAAAPIASR